MNRLLSLNLLLSLALTAQNMALADTVRLSEPVAKNANSETFGHVLNPALEKVTLAELATQSIQHMDKRFIVETKIAKVCQKKGCFFIAQQNEHVLRVSFKDYGFFIPTDSQGKTVILAGELVKKVISEKQAAHFAADLQTKSEAIKPGIIYEIIATSIKIPLH